MLKKEEMQTKDTKFHLANNICELNILSWYNIKNFK